MRSVLPIDPARIRRLFGQEPAPGDPRRICLECETLGHICRSCRAERYYVCYHPGGAPRRSLRTWWRSTALYAMNRDYPIATPLLFAAGAWWAVFALMVAAWFIGA